MKTFISFAISLLLLIGISNGQTIRTVGETGANYTTLRQAFEAVNAGTLNGQIILQLTGSTTEIASAKLNASGSGNASYTSIVIYPTLSGLSISGNLTSTLFELNGADNVTLDGRVNRTGDEINLTLSNTSASSTSSRTILFENDACNNIVKYCNLKGASTGSAGAIIFFLTTDGSTGNDNNLIEHCNLTNSGTRPTNAIYSQGSASKENSGNIISYNNIYDVLSTETNSNCIYLGSNNTDWSFIGNSFYETTNFVPSGDNTYYCIRINNSAGNNFIVTDNYIGGQSASCGGPAWSINSSQSTAFYGIQIDAGMTTASSVQNNTIKNINITSFDQEPFMGIKANSGNINIGTVTGNTIGSSTGNGSIQLTYAASAGSANSYGLYVKSSGTVSVANNNIGSITTYTSNSFAHSFYGIYKAGNISGDIVVSNNLIGSTTTPNSIQAATINTSTASQNIYGIYSGSTGVTLITNNSVVNLLNNHAYEYATNGQAVGIYTSKGNNTIQNNTVRNLSCASPSTDAVGNAAVIGISQQSTTGGQTIIGNTVYDLSSTYNGTRPVNVTGIFYYGGTSGTNTIKGNLIHGLMASSASASLTGIKVYAGTTTIANNIINLGEGISTGLTINGLYENGNAGNNNSMLFNTVYIGGTVSGTTSSTYALYSSTNNNGRDFRNNVLYNARTGGTTGNHYAIRIGGMAGVTIDYNDYFISGSPAILGQIGSQNKATFTDWKLGTTQDTKSLNINPVYANAGGTSAFDYYTSALLPGISVSEITTDYAGLIRPSTPKMGALEFNNFVWQGNISTDFGTAGNWAGNAVPPDGADISFASTPDHSCYLDQNRTLKNITNAQATCLMITNGHQLTITGNLVFSNGAMIDATSGSSEVVFAGNSAQSLPAGAMSGNTVNALSINNPAGLILNSDLTIPGTLSLLNGSFNLGANTLTLNGDLILASGLLTGGISTNMIIGGSGVSIQLPAVSLNNLTLNRSNGATMAGSVNIGGALLLTSGTLTTNANTLTYSGNSLTRSGGSIDAGNSSATLIFDNATAISLPAAVFSDAVNNLTISGSGGISAGSDFTINGLLNLESGNVSATVGCLAMGNYTLTMGSSSATTGSGDVTGIVKRQHAFNINTPYTFGSEFTTVSFIEDGLKPEWISLKITIGAAPDWNSWSPLGKVARYYDIAVSDNASVAKAVINMRYLPGELDVTNPDESKLVFWHKYTNYNGGLPHEHGKSNQNFDDHSIGVTGIIPGSSATTTIGDSEIAMAYSSNSKNTWKGEVSGFETQWEQNGNWTAGHVPLSTDDVLIPGDLTYYPSLTAAANAVVQSIEIESAASMHANEFNITITGYQGAWINNGFFYPGTGKVTFNHGIPEEIVTIGGVTNFYDIEAGENTCMQPVAGCLLRIAGTGIASESSIVDFSTINNTVEYNGVDQNIVNPSGLNGNSGYYHLILSGSGVKTMPLSAMNIQGNLTTSGPVTVTAASPLTITGQLTIQEESTFNTGNYSHTIVGNFDNSGFFNASAGNTMIFNGAASQSIFGSATTAFQNLEINNSNGVAVLSDVSVDDLLTLTLGNLNIGGITFGINGGINKVAGMIHVTLLSSLNFGGSASLSLPEGLFTSLPSINNLTLNRSGGLTLNSQGMRVMGQLELVSGTLNIAEGSLSLAGSSPIRVSGNINAGHASSNLIFENSGAVILPASLFTGDITYLSLSGQGGVTASSDFTITGILDLQNENPSETKGLLDMWDGSDMKTLTMDANATTIGQGDVTGIVRRTSFAPNTPYTFGNQFTTISFSDQGTYPAEIKVKIMIGSAPSWKPTAIKRTYDFVQTGGNDCMATVADHYLDSELNENAEETLVQWTNGTPGPPAGLYEWGNSSSNAIENWIAISNVNIGYFPTTFGQLENTLSVSELDSYCWNGSQSNNWTTLENWTPTGTPSAASNVIIPDASTTAHSPTLPLSAELHGLTIEAAGLLNAQPASQLTINGSNGAWNNTGGTFNPSTGNVTFTDAAATISGSTNFYNVTINPESALTMTNGSAMGVAGVVTNTEALWHTGNATTVEYNGGNQTVVVPDQSVNTYYNLILSGTGVKTMPVTALGILGNFSLNGAVSARTASDLAVDGELNIGSGAILTIGAGKSFTANGATSLGSAECLVLESNASGTASYMDNGSITGTGTARIERYLSPYDVVSDQKFHFITSPVGDAQAIESEFIDLTSSAITDFYKWDEQANLWINFRGDEFNVRNEAFGDGFNFVAGKGYMVAYPEASVRNFTGKPCTSALGLTIQCTNTDNRGWNLIGNPFPSSIDWDLVTKGNGMDAALYYYDNATASYRYYINLTGGLGDATQYIAPMQGFMVHAKASGVQTITMANAARTHQGAGVFYKNEPLGTNVLNLMVEGNGAKDYTRICFYELATEAFDGDFDACKLFSYNESAAQLYTVSSDNIPLAINTIPLSQLRTTKMLDFIPGAGGEYTLTAENMESFTDPGTITLKDLKTGQQQKLTDNPVYTFTAEAGNDPNRFELIFGTGAASDDEQPLTEFRLWISNNTLCVSEPQSGANLSIFDMQGRAILSGIMDGSSYLLPLMLPEGIYIVQLINDKDIYTSKVFMK